MANLSTMRNTAVAAFAILGSAQAFNPSAKNNIAMYWGQRNSDLAQLCSDSVTDIVLLSFMHAFPGSQDASGLPGTNFAGNCNSGLYPGSHLLQPCEPMPQNIQICQKNGKKVILALGGATGYQLTGAAAGEDFADKLWAMAGPVSANHGGPRPFGNSDVDGFDFDIEISSPDHQAGYIAMINRLRSYFARENKEYLITGAPQCDVPDANMGEMMTKTQFDMLFVQFYNTAACSARQFVNSGTGFTYDMLTDSLKGTPSENAKIYLGLPAASDAANDGFYLEPNEAEKLIEAYAGKDNLGGIMLWDAARAAENVIGGKPYHELMKDLLSRFTGDSSGSSIVEVNNERTTIPSIVPSVEESTSPVEVAPAFISSDIDDVEATQDISPMLNIEALSIVSPASFSELLIPTSTSEPTAVTSLSTLLSNSRLRSTSVSPMVSHTPSFNMIWAGRHWNTTGNSSLSSLSCTSGCNTALSASQKLTPASTLATKPSVLATEARSTMPTSVEEVNKGTLVKNAPTTIVVAVGALALALTYFA